MEPLFHEIFNSLPQQGPGSDACTRRAFAAISGLPPRPKILDLGCGTGRPTLALAALTAGEIVALDNNRAALERLAAKVEAAGLHGRVRLVERDVAALDFAPASFDVVWCEGAIFLVGFENGLRAWRELVPPGGALVVSEVAWIRDDPPEGARRFFASVYPAMAKDQENLAKIAAAGLELLEHFVMPAEAWWTDFYTPLEQRVGALRAPLAADRAAQELLDGLQAEVDVYREFSAWYGSVFYVLRRPR
ncbi:MAG: class I SAM-dependent methyltransferase [Planctomycetes bacterium]|nr:class I SAM-dependent methyltransferase [Planctomycetota bacterium]